MGDGGVGPDSDGLGDELHAKLGLAGLKAQHAQQMQGVEMGRIGGQHPLVALGRFVEAARLVQRQPLIAEGLKGGAVGSRRRRHLDGSPCLTAQCPRFA